MPRKTMKIQVEELTEVEVEGIALVKRGANRIPFRIIKRDGEEEPRMKFNIAELFKSAPKEPEVPTLVGIIVNKSASIEGYQKALAERGFEVLESHDIDGTDTHFLKLAEGLDDVDADVMKVNEDIALVITGLTKAFSEMPDSNSFKENLDKTQFFPGFGMATGVLHDTVRNIAFSEGNDDAIPLLKKALKDFTEFVVTLAESVPEDVRKMETLEPVKIEVKKADDGDSAGDTGDNEPKGDTKGETTDAGDGDGGKKEPLSKEGADNDGDDAGKGETSESVEEAMERLGITSQLKSLEKLGDTLEVLVQKIEESSGGYGKLEQQFKSLTKRVEKAEEDVKGTTLGGGEHVTDGKPTGSDDGESKGGMFDSVLPFAAKRE